MAIERYVATTDDVDTERCADWIAAAGRLAAAFVECWAHFVE